MKISSIRSSLFALGSIIFAAYSLGAPIIPGSPSKITYNPSANVVQGNQPFDQSYELSIKSPSHLVAGTPVTVSLGISVLSKPVGVTDATALQYITLSPSTLTFTGPNQSLKTVVRVVVTTGNIAGDYSYKILSSGWPTNPAGLEDLGATVNARVSPPNTVDTTPPSVTLLEPALSTYYYFPVTNTPAVVPVSFTASAGTGSQPITGMTAFSNNAQVVITPVGLGTLSASATGSVSLTTPGVYTVKVNATGNGTSSATKDITVLISAPPPTITVSTPANNASYSYTAGGLGASVAVSFSATSQYGNISSLSATLDGSPVSLSLSGVGSALTAVGSASLVVGATGLHTLVFSASNAYGTAVPATRTFNVTSTTPAPTVSVLTPVSGATYTRTAGDPATVVAYSFQGDATFGIVQSVVVKVDGVTVTPSLTGLGTPAVTGSGSLSYSASGQHTINVTITNDGGAKASASTMFSVTQTQSQTCKDLIWLPPISLNKTIEGGSTMPIKFTLDCHGEFVRDTSVYIAIYEVLANGNISAITTYPYGTGSPNPPDYAITGKMYHLNFKTAKGVHNYRIDVYSTAAGLPPQLLGTKDLFTKAKSPSGGDDHEDDDGDGHD